MMYAIVLHSAEGEARIKLHGGGCEDGEVREQLEELLSRAATACTSAYYNLRRP